MSNVAIIPSCGFSSTAGREEGLIDLKGTGIFYLEGKWC